MDWFYDLLKLVGLLALLFGLVSAFITKRRLRNRICTTGVVVGFETKKRYIKGVPYTVCAAVVEYKVDGREITSTDMNYTFKQALTYDIGSKVDICYDRDNIENFYMADNKIAPYVNSLTAVIVGVTMIGCGFVFPYLK